MRENAASRSIILALAMTILAAPAALTADPSALPDQVVAEVDRLIAECEFEDLQAGAEERQESLDSVNRHELNGDAFPDYLIIDGYIACPAGLSFRHGNAGTGVILWAGSEDGAHRAFDIIAFGASVEPQADGPDRVWLQLGGRYCGQDTEGVPRSEMTGCERPLVWDAEKAAFVLAPPDQTRPLGP
jgi:hypothetical protein